MSAYPLEEIIVESATLKEFNNRLFSVGPYGIRVGFSFQQSRALNLIHSLHVSKSINRDSKIAIVGGGLAGVSARLALQGLGYNRVDLYEKSEDVLLLQQFAIHRPVHPNYNDWPIVDRCSPTTNFPFLNWFAGSASSVVNKLRSEWNKYYLGSITEPFTLREVDEIKSHPAHDEDRRIQLICSLAADRPAKKTEEENPFYSHVIITSGFGPELYTEYGLSGSYWDQDQIDRIRSEKRKCYVTAAGDGGLIDCVRLCCKDVVDSNLLIELMAHLRHSKYKHTLESLDNHGFELSTHEEDIRRAEAEAVGKPVNMDAESNEPFGTEQENATAQYLAQRYKDVVSRLPSATTRFLDDHISNIQNVTLLGRLEAPFTCATAPINKLMIAYLLYRRPELYAQAYIEWTDDASGRSGTLVHKDGERKPLDKTASVLRLGSSPPVYKFSPDFKKQSRGLLRAVKELTAIQRDDDALCQNISNVACADPRSPRYMKYRKALANEYAEKHIGVCLATAFCERSSRWYFSLDADKEEFARREQDLYLKTGGFPHDLFGIPLVGETRVTISSAMGKRT